MMTFSGPLTSYLPFLIPPVIGAAIGYVTNAIAIRMLFRPLTEKRVLGVRIPFTPGIIPRQRGQLAVSIGKMVSTQLLTEEAVRSHTLSPRFQSAIRESITRFTDETLRAVPSEHSRDTVRTIVSAAESTIDAVLDRMLRSDLFVEGVGRITRNAVVSLSGTPVSVLLSDDPDAVLGIFDRLYDSITTGRLRAAVLSVLEQWLQRQLQANTPMSELISDAAVVRVHEIATGVYGPTLEHVIQWLRKPEIRTEMSRHGRVILRRIIDKLSAVQRFFVSAAQYDRQLEERMPEIIEDLIATLSAAGGDPKNRDRVIASLIDAIQKIRSQGIADAAWKGKLNVPERARQIVCELLDTMGAESVRDRVRSAVASVVAGAGRLTVKTVFADYLGIPEDRLVGIAERAVTSRIRNPGTTSAICAEIHTILTRLFTRLESESLGDVLRITPQQKERLDSLLTDGVNRIVDQRLPDIVQTLDVETLVVDKVNSLEVAQVEQLLLMVISRHLKFINLFGALLGALIGTSQILISRIF
jgi:uncharacterized membrane-anchored protein YjiN (DUF445 family)